MEHDYSTVKRDMVNLLEIATILVKMIFKRKYKSPYLSFFKRMIDLSPEVIKVILLTNFRSNQYTQAEFEDIQNNQIQKLKDCNTERQREILKIRSLSPFNLNNESSKNINIMLTRKTKKLFKKTIDEFFDESDICHCWILEGEKPILISYDGFCHNGIDKSIYLSKRELDKYSKHEMDFSEI